MDFKTVKKPLIGVILTAASIGLSSCATAHETPSAVDAVLLNAQDNPTRQAIRVFVRENSGANIISAPDSLATTPILKNHRRRTDLSIGSRRTQDISKPTGNYRLVMDENQRCWLIHQLKDDVSYLELPVSARCAPYNTP